VAPLQTLSDDVGSNLAPRSRREALAAAGAGAPRGGGTPPFLDDPNDDPLTPPDALDPFEEEDPPDDPAQDLDDADPLAPLKPAFPVEE
jgi:hypothetical protein